MVSEVHANINYNALFKEADYREATVKADEQEEEEEEQMFKEEECDLF